MPAFSFSLNDFTLSWLSLLFEGIPFLLLGTFISGMVEEFLPKRFVEKWFPKRTWFAILVSGNLGLILPMCECGIIPVLRRLMKKGVPVACAITYMLASPIVNGISFLSTMLAYQLETGWVMAVSRLAMGYLLAIATGFVVARISKDNILKPLALEDNHAQHHHHHEEKNSWRHKLVRGIHCSGHEFMEVLIYFIVGSALAAVFNTAVNREVIEPLTSHFTSATLGLMLGAALLCLCSTSDAFIAASLTSFPSASHLAFLVFGPMIDVRLILMYRMLFKRKFIVWLTLGLAIGTYLLCWLWNHVFSGGMLW